MGDEICAERLGAVERSHRNQRSALREVAVAMCAGIPRAVCVGVSVDYAGEVSRGKSRSSRQDDDYQCTEPHNAPLFDGRVDEWTQPDIATTNRRAVVAARLRISLVKLCDAGCPRQR